MKKKITLSNPVRNIITIVLIVIFILVSFNSINSTRSSVGKPFAGFLLLKNNIVPVLYLPGWEGIKRGIKYLDIIVQVNGRPVSNAAEVREIVLAGKPGDSLTYTIRRGSEQFTLSVPVSIFTLRDYLIIVLIWTLTGLCFYLMGLVVFFLKPNYPVSWAFLLLGFNAGLSMASNPGYCIDNSNVLPLIFLTAMGPSVLVLSLYFPVEIRARKYIVPIVMATTIPLIICYIYFIPRLSIYLIVDKIFLADLVITFGLGALIMGYSFITSRDPAVRQKGKIVVFAFVIAAVLGGIGLFASLVLKTLNFLWLFLVFASCPLGIGYAIVKQNIFDVDSVIRRGSVYLLVSSVVVVVSVALISGLSFILEKITGQPSEIASVITIFIMLVVFRPLRDRIDRGIERRFWGERYEYQQTIRKAGKILNSIIELDDLLAGILITVMDSMHIERGCILLREKDRDVFKPAAARGFLESSPNNPVPGPEIKPLNSDHPLIMHMEESGKALQINEIEQLPAINSSAGQMLEVMHSLKAVLLIPIFYERRMIGILALGPKMTGEWYSSEDIELLQTLMIQTAVSIENAAKVRELRKMVELESSYRELKKIDELKDHFLSMVSHDLRTPMTAITAYAGVLREEIGQLAPEKQKEYLDVILVQGDRLTRLINNLLDIQRFEAGKMEMEFQELDLTEIVLETAKAFMSLIDEKKIKLEKDIPDRQIIISGHRDRLQQVMANFISNAVKFTPEKGRIKIALELEDENGSQSARVSVLDTGPGIPLALQSRLFEKFQQVHRQVRGKQEGSGLGLALVRQIIEYHNGRVGVASEPGKGSTFYFLLPVVRFK